MFSKLYEVPAALDFQVEYLSTKSIRAGKGKRLCLISDSGAKMSPTAEETARWLAQAGWTVTWLDLSAQGIAPLDAAPYGDKKAAGTFSYEKLSGKFQELFWYTTMQSLCAYHWLKQQSFDLILFQHGFGAAYFSCSAKKAGLAFAATPILVMCDDPYAFWLEEGEFYPTAVRTDAELDHYERESVANADGVFITNPAVLDWMLGAHWPLGKDPSRIALLGDRKGQSWDKWLLSKIGTPAPKPALADKDVSLSVCITSYNRAPYLRETLKALLSQTSKDFEVIMVDGCSTDPTMDDLREEFKAVFAKRGWTWHKESVNGGLSASRNTGAKLARGTHILFKDDDNISLNDEIELFTKAVRHTDADIVTCVIGRHYLSEDTNPTVAMFPGRPSSGMPNQPIAYIYNGAVPSIGMMFNAFGDANSVIRKSVFEALGGRTIHKSTTQKDPSYEDWEFHARAALAGYTFVTLPETLYLYRLHGGNLSKNFYHKGHLSILRAYAKQVPPYIYPLLLQAATMFRSWHRSSNSTRFPDPVLFPDVANNVKTHPLFQPVPAKDVPNVAISATDQYVMQAAATLTSLLSSSATVPNIYIVSSLKANNKAILENVANEFQASLIFVDIPTNAQRRLPPSYRLDDSPQALFWSLLLPELLPALKRVIALECGVFVRHDLEDLWNFDLRDALVGAIPDDQRSFRSTDAECLPRGYFEPSVMLVDLQKWRKNNITKMALSFLTTYEKERDVKQYWAQSPLNRAINGRWALIPAMWNWPDFSLKEHQPDFSKEMKGRLHIDAKESDTLRNDGGKTIPAICRYIRHPKPWTPGSRCQSALGREFQAYLKMAEILASKSRKNADRSAKKIKRVAS